MSGDAAWWCVGEGGGGGCVRLGTRAKHPNVPIYARSTSQKNSCPSIEQNHRIHVSSILALLLELTRQLDSDRISFSFFFFFSYRYRVPIFNGSNDVELRLRYGGDEDD